MEVNLNLNFDSKLCIKPSFKHIKWENQYASGTDFTLEFFWFLVSFIVSYDKERSSDEEVVTSIIWEDPK